MDYEVAKEYVEFISNYPRRKQICICGHNVNAHHYSAAVGYICKPGNIWCECVKPVPVFFASDARCFMRSTHGIGMKHALGLGIATLHAKKGHGEWLVDLKCAVSNCPNLDISVACTDRDGQVIAKSSPYSVFLCREHALSLGGSHL
jgi:hypothetical protein